MFYDIYCYWLHTYYWKIGAEIEFKMKSENSTWTIIIWIMKLDSQRSKLEGWSIWSERARQLVSKAVEVIATGEVYDEPPMHVTNERQPIIMPIVNVFKMGLRKIIIMTSGIRLVRHRDERVSVPFVRCQRGLWTSCAPQRGQLATSDVRSSRLNRLKKFVVVKKISCFIEICTCFSCLIFKFNYRQGQINLRHLYSFILLNFQGAHVGE